MEVAENLSQLKNNKKKPKRVSVLEIKVSQHAQCLKVMSLKTDNIEDMSVTVVDLLLYNISGLNELFLT